MLGFSLTPSHFRPPSMSSLLRRLPSTSRAFSTSHVACSNIGKKPITYPTSVFFTQNSLPDGNVDLTVTGPKGSTTILVEEFINLKHQQPKLGSTSTTPAPLSSLSLTVSDASKKVQRARWGLRRTLIANAIQGLTDGFVVPIKLVGVGYRAALEDDPTGSGKRLNMKLGFAHPTFVPIPEDIVAETPMPTRIILRGTDKQRLGQFAASIRRWRKPEPYKGKVSCRKCGTVLDSILMICLLRAYLLGTRLSS